MKYLLDTHVWIWWHSNPAKLSRRVLSLIGDPKRYNELLLSAISPWEFCKLLEKGRLTGHTDPGVWIAQALNMPQLRLVPLRPAIAIGSATLPKPLHDDPADQIIVATAREEGATILTADARIREYPHVKSLW